MTALGALIKTETFSWGDAASLLMNTLLDEVLLSGGDSGSSSLSADFEEPKHWGGWMAMSSLQTIRPKKNSIACMSVIHLKVC